MKHPIAMGLLLGTLFLATSTGRPAPADKEKDAVKEALQELNVFIGDWKGNGGPVGKPRPAPSELWSEKVSWGWKFKGDDVALAINFTDSKYYKSGEMRYLTDKKKYQLTLTDVADKKLVFEGKLKDEKLTLERADADKGEKQILTVNSAAEGIRLIYRAKHIKDGTTIEINDFEVACTREGEALGPKEKKNECVVSGGLGTIPVSYKGENFYVCCSGCKEEFNLNPEKYIKEFKARKKKEK